MPVLLLGDTYKVPLGDSNAHEPITSLSGRGYLFWALTQGCLSCALVLLLKIAFMLFSCNWELLDFVFACLHAGKPSEVVRRQGELVDLALFCFFFFCYYILL